MTKFYSPPSLYQRYQIQVLLQSGENQNEIAGHFGVYTELWGRVNIENKWGNTDGLACCP
jgi:uncharacterized protein YerC